MQAHQNNYKFILIALFLLCNFKLSSNNLKDSVYFRKIDFLSKDFYYSDRNFSVFKITLDDSTFQLKGIICSDTVPVCTLTFRNMSTFGGLIWNGMEWENIYNGEHQINYIHLIDKNKDIFPSQYLYIFNGDTLQSFYCKETLNNSTDYNEYIVNKLGEIIAVKNTNTYFLRSDLILIPIFQIRRK